MKNILQLVISPPLIDGKNSITGPERRAARLAGKWKDHGFNLVVCYPKRGRLNKDFEAAGIETIDWEIGSKFNFKSALKLRKIIKQYNIDLVHSQGPASLDLILALACVFLKVKTVVTRPVMLSDQINYSSLRRRIYEIVDQYVTLKLIHCFIAVSDNGRQVLKNRYKVKAKKVELIYNGVNTTKLTPNPKDSSDSKEFIIGMIGQLFPPKGWYDFIDAIDYIQQNTQTPIKAFVIGEGQMMAELKACVDEKKLNDVIVFKGYIDNIKLMLDQIDLILFTTHREGLSVAILEAMSMGVPQVITNVGGGKEQIIDGVNGYVYEVGQIQEMGDKCIELIESPNKLEELGKNAREIALEKFSEDSMFQNHLNVYNSLLK